MPSSRSRSPSPSSPEDIATAMGFSSFGAKPNPPKKKRRLADQPNTEGSGTNNTPLGVRTRTPGTQQEGVRRAKHKPAGTDMGTETGGVRGQEQRSEAQDKRTVSDGLGIPNPDPDTLAAAALDETARMLLETGLLPHYLDWGDGGFAGSSGPRDDDDERKWKGQQGQSGGGVGVGEEMRRQGKRGDGEWDWQALRRGVVDERGDVVFYDGSFVEDPWRGLGFRGGRGEGG